jgi:hypothetical protein
MRLMIVLLCLVVGCRHCERHTCSKPKAKQKLVSRLESGTKMYAEGFGPNRDNGKYSASPFESVDLKAVLEYQLEW